MSEQREQWWTDPAHWQPKPEQVPDPSEPITDALAGEIEFLLGDDFRVCDAGSADWVVAQITRWRDELARVKAQMEKITGRIEGEIKFFETRYEEQLRDWAKTAITGKRKSIDLPHGRVGFRHVGERVEVIEEEAAIEAARASVPEAVKVKVSLSLTALKEHFKATGEILPGCGVVPAEERFYVQ